MLTLDLGHSRSDRLILQHHHHIIVDRAERVVRRKAVSVVLTERKQELWLVLVHLVNADRDLHLVRQFAFAVLVPSFDLQLVEENVTINLERCLACPQFAGDFVQFKYVVQVAAQDAVLDQTVQTFVGIGGVQAQHQIAHLVTRTREVGRIEIVLFAYVRIIVDFECIRRQRLEYGFIIIFVYFWVF